MLQDILKSGILESDNVLDKYMATKREQIKKIHPYAITPPSSEKGRWQTFYKNKDGIRKNIKAQSEADLLDKLITIYSLNNNQNKITFYDLLNFPTNIIGEDA